MARKRLDKRYVRIKRDPVTSELEVTVLDAVQLAFERVIQTIDGQMLKVGDSAGRDRLACMILDRVELMLPHTEGGSCKGE